MASFCWELKPTASRSARVLGRSLGAQVNVMRAPPFPKIYVVPAGNGDRETDIRGVRGGHVESFRDERQLNFYNLKYHSLSSFLLQSVMWWDDIFLADKYGRWRQNEQHSVIFSIQHRWKSSVRNKQPTAVSQLHSFHGLLMKDSVMGKWPPKLSHGTWGQK